VREGFRIGSQGVTHDDILTNQDWGFDLAEIRPRVDIWHGDRDVNVPPHAATFLNKAIPHTRLTIVPNAGHFLWLSNWQQVLSALIVEATG
jgi:pimeloyl-ACP methyl ester carboxylesterase